MGWGGRGEGGGSQLPTYHSFFFLLIPQMRWKKRGRGRGRGRNRGRRQEQEQEREREKEPMHFGWGIGTYCEVHYLPPSPPIWGNRSRYILYTGSYIMICWRGPPPLLSPLLFNHLLPSISAHTLLLPYSSRYLRMYCWLEYMISLYKLLTFLFFLDWYIHVCTVPSSQHKSTQQGMHH